MGNVGFTCMAKRSEAANIMTMKTLLTKYESLRAAGKIADTTDGNISNGNNIQHTAHLSDEELYRELQHELLSGLGITKSSQGSEAQPPAPPPAPGSTAAVDEHHRHANRATAAGAAAAEASTEASASERQDKDPPLPETRVLVVDDSHISCKLAVRALSQHNFHCEVALDGQLGLDLLLQRPSDFDLVLLDIVMPVLDGIEVLNRMKAHPQLKEVPVAMLSGLEDQALADICLQKGAVAVLQKPMKIEGILTVVKDHCNRPSAPKSTVSSVSSCSSLEIHTEPWQQQQQQQQQQPRQGNGAVPNQSGDLYPGTTAPNVDLLDAKYHSSRLLEVLARNSSRGLLLVFFPAAIAEAAAHGMAVSWGGQGGGKDGADGQGGAPASRCWKGSRGVEVLSAVRDNMTAIKATGTEIVAIGSDLPSALSGLSAELGLQFPVLSDPFLQAAEAYVGTFDLDIPSPVASGGGRASMSGYRVSHTGLVVLDSAGVFRYRWVAKNDSAREPVDITRMLDVLCESVAPCETFRQAQPLSFRGEVPDHSGDDGSDRYVDADVHACNDTDEAKRVVAAAGEIMGTTGGARRHVEHQHHPRQQQQQQHSASGASTAVANTGAAAARRIVSTPTTCAASGDIAINDSTRPNHRETTEQRHKQTPLLATGPMAYPQSPPREHEITEAAAAAASGRPARRISPNRSNGNTSRTTEREAGMVVERNVNKAGAGEGTVRGAILVVDDSAISSKLAMRKLGALGHATEHAANGQAALALLRRDPTKFFLVLLDVVMPVMDGVELLTLIKGDDALRHIPVIMLSGLEDQNLGTVCLESGAAAVFQKPLKADEVQNVLNKHRQRSSIATPTP